MTTPTKTRLPQNQPLAVRTLTAEVRSETNPDKAYVVTLPFCPCADFHNRRGNPFSLLCKHLKAALGIPDTTKLDEMTAIELLADLKVHATTAAAAVRRSRECVQATTALPDGSIVVVLYDRRGGTYDVRLP